MRDSAAVYVAGIDPGSETGIVIAQLSARSRDISLAAWVGSCSVSGMAKTQTRTRAEGHVMLYERVRDQLALHNVREVAIECPVDALPSWGAASGRRSNPATLFSLGANYGLCLAAARAAGVSKIMSYRVKTTREHAGWMPMVRGGAHGNLMHPQRRDITLQQLRAQVAAFVPRCWHGALVGVSVNAEQLSEDEIMAYGVLAYHLRRTPLPPV